MMETVDSHDFNIFEVKRSTKENELITIMTYILHKHNVFSSLSIKMETFFNFANSVQNGYNNVSYHNKTHAADLSCTAYFLLTKGGFWTKGKLDDLEFASMIIGGACHDLGHFGVNNLYLVETKHELAIRYNDVSVLENHHVATAFSLLSDPKNDITANFSKDDFKRFRQRMIGLILSTDMAKHFGELSRFKTRVAAADFSPDGGDKELVMNMIFHLSDISNTFKKFEVC